MWIKTDKGNCIEDVVAYNTKMAINEFLYPKSRPYVKGLQDIADELTTAIKNGKFITAFGDYDADGITASSQVYIALRLLNAKFEVLLPRRFSDGYGFSAKTFQRINPATQVLLTIDNGISANEAISAAKERGMTVLVLDHHLPRDEYPEADVICDPSAEKETEGSEFRNYCAAGLAFRLCELLLGERHPVMPQLLSLSAIGTVADVMPLKGDNRNIVYSGLMQLNSHHNLAAIEQLKCQLKMQYISEKDLGFRLGPIINAAGRLDDNGPQMCMEALTGQNMSFIAKLIDYNEQRKALCQTQMEVIDQIIEDNVLYTDNAIVVYTDTSMETLFHEGLVGILAGRITEKWNVPAIVLTEISPGILKGSGRSPEGINLKDCLDQCKDFLLGYGGHAGAAGLSLKLDDIDAFIEAFIKTVPNKKAQSEDVYYDLEIDASEVPQKLTELCKYAPYGEGNAEICFLVKNVKTQPNGNCGYRIMGNKGQHIKLFSANFDLVGFDMSERYKESNNPTLLDVVGTLSVNVFNGVARPQVEMIDFRENRLSKSNLAKALEDRLTAWKKTLNEKEGKE